MRKLLIFILLISSFIPLLGQNNIITGVVKSEEGDLLIGTTVTVKGTKTGTITDSKGCFSIKIPTNNPELEFSYIGYERKTVKISSAKPLNVILQESTKSLDETVVIGYGVSRKVDITGAVTSVKSDVSENRVVLSVSDALKGKVSGVNIFSVDGAPGSDNNNITIRGNTSLSSNSSPLYVIDGVASDFMNVSPGEIESIDILKDASSTAIYGARGANGVILVTTKKGKSKDQLSFYVLYGIQSATNKLNLMDADQFIEKNYFFSLSYTPKGKFNPATAVPTAYNYYSDNEGNVYQISKTAAYANEYFKTDPTQTRYNTNWQNVMMHDATIQDYRVNLSGSGNGNKNNYSVMLGSRSQEGIIINSGYKEYSGRINFNQTIFDKSKLFINSSFNSNTTTGFNSGNLGVIWRMITAAPSRPEDYTMSFLLPNELTVGTVESNPKTIANSLTNENNGYNFLTNMGVEIPIIKELILRLSGSYFLAGRNIDQYTPSTIPLNNADANKGLASMYNEKQIRMGSENTLQYNKQFTYTRLGIMLGNSLYKTDFRRLQTQNTNFSLEDLGVWGISEGTVPLVPISNSFTKSSISFFTRINYDISDKYLLKATLRADGSSVFAKNNKWGFFPSAAAAWRINQESWMKSIKSISNLKLRASWGISGKEAIGAYASLPTVYSSDKTSLNGSSTVPVAYFSAIGNENLKWETTEEIDLGFDLGLLNERITITSDIYNRITRDLLYNDPIPTYTGFSNLTRNIGSIQNQGIEVAIKVVPIRNKDFSWNMDFNIAKNISKVLKLGVRVWQNISTGWIGTSTQGKIQVGEPLGNWFGYKTNGIWQTQAEIDEAIANKTLLPTEVVKPGYVKYVDLNGDGKITADDAQKIGNGTPDFTGGFTNSINYKGFGLDFTLQFVTGNDIFNGYSRTLESGAEYNNAYAATANRWSPTLYQYNPTTDTKGDLYLQGNASNRYPIAISGKIVPEMPIDLWIEDGSFIRLADITFSYTFPKKILSKLKISNVKLFVTGSNLFVLTKYSGFDPEVNGSIGTAAYLMPGLDFGNYPKSRVVSGGFNIIF